jgi:hypothetical protein
VSFRLKSLLATVVNSIRQIGLTEITEPIQQRLAIQIETGHVFPPNPLVTDPSDVCAAGKRRLEKGVSQETQSV